MRKIAFCFLIYDTIIHEEVWNLFFKNVDKNKYNIYIHYKTNTPLQYFDKYKLDFCIETNYTDITIVYAENILLQEARRDPDNQHFIFISGACIPFKNFNEVYEALDPNYSYFNITPQSQCFPRCNPILQHIDKKYIQKSSQWCILNRKHSELMLYKNEYLNWFDSSSISPEEHCYITNIYYNHLENEIITTPNIANDSTTFTNWEGMDYKYPSNRGLKNYDFISDEELHYLLKSKSLFGRKFTIHSKSLLLNNYNYLRHISS